MSDLGGRFQCMGRLRYGSSSPGTPGGALLGLECVRGACAGMGVTKRRQGPLAVLSPPVGPDTWRCQLLGAPWRMDHS